MADIVNLEGVTRLVDPSVRPDFDPSTIQRPWRQHLKRWCAECILLILWCAQFAGLLFAASRYMTPQSVAWYVVAIMGVTLSCLITATGCWLVYRSISFDD